MVYSVMSSKVEVRNSPIHGKGMFAKTNIEKGEVVFIKGGYILSKDELIVIYHLMIIIFLLQGIKKRNYILNYIIIILVILIADCEVRLLLLHLEMLIKEKN